jgi:excinuclease ABC subunit B
MRRAIKEVERRRGYQLDYNKKHGIVPQTIEKPIRERLTEKIEEEEVGVIERLRKVKGLVSDPVTSKILATDPDGLTPEDNKKLIKFLRRLMREAAKELNFELAAEIRDKVRELEVVNN